MWPQLKEEYLWVLVGLGTLIFNIPNFGTDR